MSDKIDIQKLVCLENRQRALELLGEVWLDQCETEEKNQRRLQALEESVKFLRETVARILYREAEAKLPATIPDL